MRSTRSKGIAWLEPLLVVAVVSLMFQLFPSTWWWLVRVVDARKWSRRTCFLVNLFFLLVLVAVRAAPEIKASVARRRAEAAKRRKSEQRRQAALDREARMSRRIR
ncbi:MAG: hypothetical protein ACC645_26260 [Pirellulales bacterium]